MKVGWFWMLTYRHGRWLTKHNTIKKKGQE